MSLIGSQDLWFGGLWGSGLGYDLFVMYQRISEIWSLIDLILLHLPTPINRSLNPSCQTLH